MLVGIGAISAAGLLAPSRYTDPVRTAVNDALRPGRTVSLIATAHLQSTWARFRTAETDDDLETMQTEVAVLRARLQQQQAGHVALIQQTSAESAGGSAGPSEAYNPLLAANLVPAAVLGRQPDVLRNRFARILNRGTSSQITVDDLVLADQPHIDQGTDAGVQERQPVISGRVVVGSIGQAGRWTSTLQLVTDPDYRAKVQLVRESPAGLVLGAVGVLRGNGSETCALEYVPGNEPVSVGDYVYSRQQDVDQAQPLYYGRVLAADIQPGEENWSIEVEPAFAPPALQSVQVLTISLNPQRIGEPLAIERSATESAVFSPLSDDPQQP